jgi:hypothetical protein
MGALPEYAEGMLRECFRCGFWYPERSGNIVRYKGKWTCLADIDKFDEDDRRNSKIRR